MAEQGMTVSRNSEMQKLQSTNLKTSSVKEELTDNEKISAFIMKDNKVDEWSAVQAYAQGQISENELRALGFEFTERQVIDIYNNLNAGTWYSPILTTFFFFFFGGTAGSILGALTGFFTKEGPKFGAAYLGTGCALLLGAYGLLYELSGRHVFCKKDIQTKFEKEMIIITPSGEEVKITPSGEIIRSSRLNSY